MELLARTKEPFSESTSTRSLRKKTVASYGAFTVTNVAGIELPSTGGTGTMAYTMTGLTLILLAGALLISRKRK